MNKSVLFVKAKSRLGLLNPPKGELHLNRGVEEGPDHVVSQIFLQQFTQKEIIPYTFSSPESVQKDTYYQTLSDEYYQLISIIAAQYQKSTMLVTVGGDHSVSLASVAAVLRAHAPNSVGLIMIDSHADLHTSESTQTGNFHGMWLRAACDSFPIRSIDELVPEKIPNQNMVYLGNLDVESAEQEYISNHGISVFGSDSFGSNNFDEKISQYLGTMSHIHVSIDIDAFSHLDAPATGMKITSGLVPSSVLNILHKLKTHPSLSVDLVEVNPLLPGSKKTIRLAHQLLLEILT
jgi:arginase